MPNLFQPHFDSGAHQPFDLVPTFTKTKKLEHNKLIIITK